MAKYAKRKINRYAWDDGVINCTCILEGRKWRDVFREYAEIGGELLTMPSNENVIDKYMAYHRYHEVSAGGTVADFADKHPNGRYAVVMPAGTDEVSLTDHLTAIVDGVVTGGEDTRTRRAKYAYAVPGVTPFKSDHVTYAEYDNTTWPAPMGGNVQAIVNPLAWDDCVINSLCLVTGRKWRDVYTECCELGYKYMRMPHSYRVVREFMKSHDWHYRQIPKGRKTVGAFRRDHPKGKWLVLMRGHAVAVMDGLVYNTGEYGLDIYPIMRAYYIGA